MHNKGAGCAGRYHAIYIFTTPINESIVHVHYKLMGILRAHTGAIGCIHVGLSKHSITIRLNTRKKL